MIVPEQWTSIASI